MTYTLPQMLTLVRQMCHLEPQRSDCSIDVVTGIDVNGVLTRFLRHWYLDLMDHAHPSMLVPQSARTLLDLAADTEGIVTTTVPANVRRLLCVQLEGWRRPALIVRPTAPVAYSQCSRYTRAGVNNPLAVYNDATRLLTLYSLPPGTTPRWRHAQAIIEPDSQQQFLFDERALQTIPTALHQYFNLHPEENPWGEL